MPAGIQAGADDPVAIFARRHFGDLEQLGEGCGELATRIRSWMREHDVVFAGHEIPFVMAPHCLPRATIDRVRHAVEVLTRVLDRFCSAYRTDEPLRHALDETLADIASLGGTGGIIAVAPSGEAAWGFTTPGMYRGSATAEGRNVALYSDDEER